MDDDKIEAICLGDMQVACMAFEHAGDLERVMSAFRELKGICEHL